MSLTHQAVCVAPSQRPNALNLVTLRTICVDRGASADDVPAQRVEAATGAVFANLIACFIIVAAAATLFEHGVHSIGSAADAARALEPIAGSYAEELFAVGLLGASLLASAILPVTTGYVIAEVFGFEKGLSHRPREAPVFTAVLTGFIAIGAVVAILPGVPVIGLLIGVQVVNGALLPITFVLGRRYPIRRGHLARNLGITAFVGIEQLAMMQSAEPQDENDDGQQHQFPARQRAHEGQARVGGGGKRAQFSRI